MTERLHFIFSLSCIGEGNGNPFPCSCLENPRDGGAWWAAIYGVAQSRTRLKRLSSSSSTLLPIIRFLVWLNWGRQTFCKGSDSKYFRFCESHCLSHSYLTLTMQGEICYRQQANNRCVPINFIYGNRQWAGFGQWDIACQILVWSVFTISSSVARSQRATVSSGVREQEFTKPEAWTIGILNQCTCTTPDLSNQLSY